MEGEQQRCTVGDLQPAAPFESVCVEGFEFLEHSVEVHDDTITENIHGVLINQTTWQQVEGVLFAIGHHGVPSIGTTIESANDVVVLGQHVGQFPLAFVTPLTTKNCSHT